LSVTTKHAFCFELKERIQQGATTEVVLKTNKKGQKGPPLAQWLEVVRNQRVFNESKLPEKRTHHNFPGSLSQRDHFLLGKAKDYTLFYFPVRVYNGQTKGKRKLRDEDSF